LLLPLDAQTVSNRQLSDALPRSFYIYQAVMR